MSSYHNAEYFTKLHLYILHVVEYKSPRASVSASMREPNPLYDGNDSYVRQPQPLHPEGEGLR